MLRRIFMISPRPEKTTALQGYEIVAALDRRGFVNVERGSPGPYTVRHFCEGRSDRIGSLVPTSDAGEKGPWTIHYDQDDFNDEGNGPLQRQRFTANATVSIRVRGGLPVNFKIVDIRPV